MGWGSGAHIKQAKCVDGRRRAEHVCKQIGRRVRWSAMIGENRQLFTNEPVEFEKLTG